MNDKETWLQFARFQDRQEKRYIKRFYALFRRQALRVATSIRNVGIETTEASLSLLVTRREVETELRALYKQVGVAWANVEYGNLERYTKSLTPIRTKSFGFNAEWESILDIFFAAQGGEKIVSIDDTTRLWLIRRIQEGRSAGLGAEQIARSMIDDKDVPLRRARVIARTETVAAANFGGITAARKTGLKMAKRWVNAKDGRVRELHKDKAQGGIGGEIVLLEDVFSNGLMHPGDPLGSARQVIQCRCIASMRPVRDEEGMPVNL